MNVADLRAALNDLPADLIVVMSKDSGGNGFSPMAEVDAAARYQPESDWAGEVLHPDEFDEYPDACPAVCLWPTN